MKTITEGNVTAQVDNKGNLLLIGEFTILINKSNANNLFLSGKYDDPNQGLFPMFSGEKLCLSVMPDDVAKIALDLNQVEAIRNIL